MLNKLGIKTNSTYNIGTASVVWSPENESSYTVFPVPTGITGQTQVESDYYYSYTYTHIVELVNIALNSAWTSAGGGVTGLVSLSVLMKATMAFS